MAAFLQKSDPWIENTFVHACSFTAEQQGADHAATQPQDEEEFFDSQQDWEQTENTIPEGLLPSQPPESAHNSYADSPSRQSKIVQITYRGGSGWDGSVVHANGDRCPPYVVLHDGRHSAVAFLSDKAMASVGINVGDSTTGKRGKGSVKTTRMRNKTDSAYESDNSSTNSKMCGRAERAARRAARNDYSITLRNKSLACITHYTISTIKQCCSAQHRTAVINTLDIPTNMQQQLHLQLDLELLMCIYLQGPIVVIGAENQGLIGDTVDVHCSAKVRQALRDFSATTKEEGGGDSYWKLMQTLEACHCFYMETAQRRMDRENEETAYDNVLIAGWPWKSRLKSDSSQHENPALVQGSVTQFMMHNEGDVDGNGVKGLELDHVLGSHLEEVEDIGNQVVVDRTSRGTLVRWHEGTNTGYSDMNGGHNNDTDQKDGKENMGRKSIEAEISSSVGVQQGDAAELFNNYQYLDDVLDFSQQVKAFVDGEEGDGIRPTITTTEKDKARKDLNAMETLKASCEDSSSSPKQLIEKQTSENSVSFVGIDQMINNNSDEESDDDISECADQCLTQAESISKDIAEIPLDTEQHSLAELKSDGKSSKTQPPSTPIKDVEGDPGSQGHSTPDPNSIRHVNRSKSFEIEIMDTQLSISFSQPHHRDKYCCSDEPPVDSQVSICAESLVKSHKAGTVKKNSVPVESQVHVMVQKEASQDTGYVGRKNANESAPESSDVKTKKSTYEMYDSDDLLSWMKVQKIKPKEKTRRKPTASQQRSQMAGERSEENTTLSEVVGSDGVDCSQEEGVVHNQDESLQNQESNQHVRFHICDTSIEATSTGPESSCDKSEAISSERNKAVRKFDIDRFLTKAKRLCKP